MKWRIILSSNDKSSRDGKQATK